LGFEDKLRSIKELNKEEERMKINTQKSKKKDRENQKRMK